LGYYLTGRDGIEFLSVEGYIYGFDVCGSNEGWRNNSIDQACRLDTRDGSLVGLCVCLSGNSHGCVCDRSQCSGDCTLRLGTSHHKAEIPLPVDS
jgi:hypothetical protein